VNTSEVPKMTTLLCVVSPKSLALSRSISLK
jgi:hypothetical protein